MLSKYTNSLKRGVSRNPGMTLLLIAVLIGALMYVFVKPRMWSAPKSEPSPPPAPKAKAKDASKSSSSTEDDAKVEEEIVEAFRNRRRRNRWY